MAGEQTSFLPRGTGAFLGGMLAAIVVSRLLPPVAAQARGSTSAVFGKDPFDALAADHRHFLSLLTQMEESQARGRSALHRTQLLLRLKRGLAAHAMAEEDVVYPLLHDEARADHEAKHLYGEHADIKIHLYALEQMPKDSPAWTDRVRELKRLIEEHARQEEEVEFPKLRAALDGERIARMAGHIQREKALIL